MTGDFFSASETSITPLPDSDRSRCRAEKGRGREFFG